MAENFGLSLILKLVDELSTPLEKVGNKFKEMQKTHDSMGRQLTSVGKTMTTFATTIMGGAAALAMNEARKLEGAFVGMQQTIHMPLAALHELEAQLENVAMATGHSVEELMAISQVAGRASLEDIPAFVKMMADLSKATGDFQGQEGAKAFQQIGVAMGLAEKEYKSLASSLAWGQDNFNISASAVAEMSRQLSGLAAITPITNKQIIALSTWAGSFGQEGGTAMINIMNKMGKAVQEGMGEQVSWFAEVSGKSVPEFLKLFKTDSPAAFAAFAEGIKRLNSEDVRATKILERMGLEGVRTLKTLTISANAAGSLEKAQAGVNKAWEEGTHQAQSANMHYETMDGQLGRLKETYGALMKQFGDLVLPLVKSLVSALTWLLQKFTHLPTPIKYVVAALGGLLAIAGPLLIGLGGIVSNLGLLALAGPAIVAALAPAAALLGAMALKAAAVMAVFGAAYAVGGAINQGIDWLTAKATGEGGATLGGKVWDWTHPEAAANARGDRSETHVKISLDRGLKTDEVKKKAGRAAVTTEQSVYGGAPEMAY